MTSKEALVRLYDAIDKNLLYDQMGIIFSIDLYNLIKKDLERLEKLEKAIKILKNKKVSIELLLKTNILNEYNRVRHLYDADFLIQKEFKLLKEVFEDA